MAEHTNMVNSISFKLDKDDDFTPDEEEHPGDFLDLFGLLLHTADLYTPAKEYRISRIWADRINMEFMDQLKCEEKLDLPVTSFYRGLDNLVTRAKSESFFVGCIVTPLWRLLDRALQGDLKP
jgi:3'5'-cyclic nucleotide phosphodiesterase